MNNAEFLRLCTDFNNTYPHIPLNFHQAGEHPAFWKTDYFGEYLITGLTCQLFIAPYKEKNSINHSGIPLTTIQSHCKGAIQYFSRIFGFDIMEHSPYFNEPENLREFLFKLNLAFKYDWKIGQGKKPEHVFFYKDDWIISFPSKSATLRKKGGAIITTYSLCQMEILLKQAMVEELMMKKTSLEEELRKVTDQLFNISNG